MTVDPISVATEGYVCEQKPNDISIATHGYVCISAIVTATVQASRRVMVAMVGYFRREA